MYSSLFFTLLKGVQLSGVTAHKVTNRRLRSSGASGDDDDDISRRNIVVVVFYLHDKKSSGKQLAVACTQEEKAGKYKVAEVITFIAAILRHVLSKSAEQKRKVTIARSHFMRCR